MSWQPPGPPFYDPSFQPWVHHPPPPPHGHHPPPHGHHHPPPHGHFPPYGPPGHGPPGPYPGFYLPGTMMVPVPISQPEQSQPTYVTNYIYHGENQNPAPAITDQVKEETQAIEGARVVESSGDFDWIPTTSTLANTLTGRAVVGGQEGWDGSPLWVIRAWHNGELMPGKLSVRHNAASIAYNGKEVPVQNIEVLCTVPEHLRWVPASNGEVPPSAIPGGQTTSGEPVFVGRARYQLSLTPGRVQQSLQSCYISFAGAEVAVQQYDVLCRVS